MFSLSSRTTSEGETPFPIENQKLPGANSGTETSIASALPGTPDDATLKSQENKPISLVGKRIVVIEDEGITQMQLNRLLKQAGLEVVGVAGDGVTGTDVVLRERPDLVLMDIRMPRRDGIEATEQILAIYPVCVVMLTAYADETLQEKARLAGASGYLVKPITGLTLLPQLQTAYENFLAR